MSSLTYCEAYFIRHGQTQWNLEKRLQGHMDIPLNETGIEQAKQLRAKLSNIKFQSAYSSDLSRAYETATIVLDSKDIPILRTEKLRETKLGSWEGKPVEELKSWISDRSISNDGFERQEYFAHKWHDEVESVGEVFQRVIDHIATELITQVGKTVLISSHGGVLESIIHHLSFDPKQRWKVTNCGWIKLHFYEDKHFELIEQEGVHSTSDTSIV